MTNSPSPSLLGFFAREDYLRGAGPSLAHALRQTAMELGWRMHASARSSAEFFDGWLAHQRREESAKRPTPAKKMLPWRVIVCRSAVSSTVELESESCGG